ncbi:4-hydroxy-3-methylbut-2-enyl diphosphate reductase [Planctomicrobium piriforme]|uniref:4-hydroxy-3-methylbut-2-enyl diphosphate reductase n=1 Tax=Planctomicrobium piriforme TaxID=1576369 RepID=A0A1I3FYJ4_9PLAN|nr:4-hydroxy-3-methylbut-2-enyl diphosphate reductase [Planctomicrobium piriforme]SFI16265.1 4-hydroxy-3-methylbut-2-enyl diphosphate reductase [Planctomicrobium piriforme]
MQVILAQSFGMCFGVRDALTLVENLPVPDQVTIHGELVHNPQVLLQLKSRGYYSSSEQDRRELPVTPQVLITAHGISDLERQRLEAAGKTLIDTTCPLVRRAHTAASKLADDGRHVIVIGKPGHVEVQGIIEDLDSYTVVEQAADVVTWPQARLGVICQTTTPPRIAAEIVFAIEHQNRHADVRFVNTICQPTLDRQLAVELLCLEVDVVIVVGGANSNNTLQLVELARACGCPAWQVNGPDELRDEWLQGSSIVGLTAGTSTLDATLQAVHQRLLNWPTPQLAAAYLKSQIEPDPIQGTADVCLDAQVNASPSRI